MAEDLFTVTNDVDEKGHPIIRLKPIPRQEGDTAFVAVPGSITLSAMAAADPDVVSESELAWRKLDFRSRAPFVPEMGADGWFGITPHPIEDPLDAECKGLD